MNPNKGGFPPRWFAKMLGYLSREMIREEEFLVEFLTWFDPDSALELCNELPPAVRERLRAELASSPATEEDWRAIAESAQRRGAAQREALGNCQPTLAASCAMGDLDGYWDFAEGFPLKRAPVYALRQALGLPTHEEPWEVWYERHGSDLRNCALHPWVLENRAHWYCYLDRSGYPFYAATGNPFANAPDRNSEDALRLHREMDFLNSTIEQVRFRADFVAQMYPHYFFNAKRRLYELVGQRESIADQLDCIGRFLASRPETLSRVFVEQGHRIVVSVGGTVSNETDLIPLLEFLRTTFREKFLERSPEAADHFLDSMVNVKVEKE